MKKRGVTSRKGQFYIIAAIIIVIILVGMAGVSNYVSVQEEPTGFYDLGKDIGLEGASIIDYGIHLDQSIDNEVADFTKLYGEYISKTSENFTLAIVYGNSVSATIVKVYPKETGYVSGAGIIIPGTDNILIESETIYTSSADIEIYKTTYHFDLETNENFFFVIAKSKGFETFIYEKAS